MPRLGLIVNPIAGLGGAVALHGTDGRALEALAKGGRAVAHARAVRFLARLPADVRVLTCSGPMGAAACIEAGRAHDLALDVSDPTTAADTRRAAKVLVQRGVDLLTFVGGDGTARDVAQEVGHDVVVLGVPSGVKMNSAVFAESPEVAAHVAAHFLAGDLGAHVRDVVEVDEEGVRAGDVRPAKLATLRVPATSSIAGSKAELGGDLESVVQAIQELAEADRTLVLGPGATLYACKVALVGRGTLLGVDVVEVSAGGKCALVLEDATAAHLALVKAGDSILVLSPIGGQGFVVGRGNQQVTPDFLRRLGWSRVTVVATTEKLATLDALRVDTGDPALDAEVPPSLSVVTGPGFRRLVRVRRPVN